MTNPRARDCNGMSIVVLCLSFSCRLLVVIEGLGAESDAVVMLFPDLHCGTYVLALLCRGAALILWR